MIDDFWIEQTCKWWVGPDHAGAPEVLLSHLRAADAPQLEVLLDALADAADALPESDRDRCASRLRLVLQAVVGRARSAKADPDEGAWIAPDSLLTAASAFAKIDQRSAALVLQILAAQGDAASLSGLAASLDAGPLDDWQSVALALSPLWNASSSELELFFECLDGVAIQAASLPVLLDLANFGLQSGKLYAHPWAPRAAKLTQLMTSVTRQLQALERDPSQFGKQVADVQRMLHEGVALTISLCAALGWIGDDDAVESLSQTMQLSHRRIQTEAACALARLGVDSGRARLIQLAEDPVARRTAVRFAEELGFAEEVDDRYQNPVALAESELANWLAEPAQAGLPPARLSLIDARSLFWPSYDEPRDCFLFQFEYESTGESVCNVGMAGPMVHAFRSNLSDLPTDDMYAAFAGWQAEHREIYEIPATALGHADRQAMSALADHVREADLEMVEPIALTYFFGQPALLARVRGGAANGAERHAHASPTALAVTDGTELVCFPTSDDPAALTPELVLAIFRGRKLLRTFNPDFS